MAETTLVSKIQLLATRMGQECKGLHDEIGTLSNLSTLTFEERASVVNALATILGKANAAAGVASGAATAVATLDKTVNGYTPEGQSKVLGLTDKVTTLQSDVSALQAISHLTIDNDAPTSDTKTYSALKIETIVSEAVAGVKNELLGYGEGEDVNAALDTIKEIAAALTTDDGALKDVVAALGQSAVKFSEQTLTDTQKTQARTNIAAASAADVTAVEERVDVVEKAINGYTPEGGEHVDGLSARMTAAETAASGAATAVATLRGEIKGESESDDFVAAFEAALNFEQTGDA